MVATEDIFRDFALVSVGSENADIDVYIPALGPGVTLSFTYNPPANYTWFKMDTRIHQLTNRVIQLTLIADGNIIIYNRLLGTGYQQESWRCWGVGSIVHTYITATVTNTDVVARPVDLTIRGALITDSNVKKFIEIMRTTTLSSEDKKLLTDVKDLLEKIYAKS